MGETEKFDFESWEQGLTQRYSEYLAVAHQAGSDPILKAEAKTKYSELVAEVAATLRKVQSDDEKTQVVDVFSNVITKTPGALNSAGRIFGTSRNTTFWEDVAIAASK